MCGICGSFSWGAAPDRTVVEAMTRTLSHRGPDAMGIHVDAFAGLGHTRLSIIDLSAAGAQPIGNEDGSVLCVFNGEIYNFQELRDALIAKGHVFRGHSDSEVLVHLYEDAGDRLFERIRGMFALAIYDRRQRRLTLGRDRFGIKPLYYAELADGIVFGSELKAVLADPRVPRRVDAQAIHDYLSLLYVPSPATAFADIREVPPAHVITWSGRQRTERRYWSPPGPTDTTFTDANLDEIGERFDAAVAAQLVSDVPLGATLSGGIDSSLVVESASRQLGRDRRLPAFTVGFPDPAYDESELAAETAAACGLEHHILALPLHSSDVDLMCRLLVHFDQPFADSSAIPTYLICQRIREHVKVCLSGDGGDEIFGGYDNFWRAPAIHRLGGLPGPVAGGLIGLLRLGRHVSPDLSRQLVKAMRLSRLDSPRLHFALAAYLNEEQKSALYAHGGSTQAPTWRLFEGSAGLNGSATADQFSAGITESMLRLSLPGDMLRKVDMMSMLNGLEVRVPMLDEELAGCALRLRHSAKVHGRSCKWTLRRIAERRLPRRIARKKKTGFNLPMDKWASSALHDRLRETLVGPQTRIAAFLDQKTISGWVDAFVRGENQLAEISRDGLHQRVYTLLSLELWLRHYRPAGT